MLRWDALDEVRVCLDGDLPEAAAVAAAAACTLPLVVHDYQRAAVLGTATLLAAGRRALLLTAAHVIDGGVRLGNLLVPAATGHDLIPLAGARVARSGRADIALLDIGAVPGAAQILRGRRPALMPPHALRRRRRHAPPRSGALVSGYPAALARFERGWLAARRLTLFTRRHAEEGDAGEHLYVYGRVANRADGTPIHTPELPGMSGAGIWAIHRRSAATMLRLVAVQSSYLHGRYLRGHDVAAVQELMRL
ncbi:MAG: hypothetical protein JNM90_03045 [Burkholderiales bacterium]|nr:hypothetical protein [Burkholderiales bacterium]